jgi:hypothetical protein
MAESAPTSRIEPTVASGPDPKSQGVSALKAAVEQPKPAPASPAPAPAPAAAPVGEPAPPPRPAGLEQLFRIEEKVARIEEKYARSEALLQRVEAKMDAWAGRAAEGARQADLVAARDQMTGLTRSVRRLPGLTALVFTALVTAVLTSALTLALLKYGVPGLTR